eukprot:gene30724-35753_t
MSGRQQQGLTGQRDSYSRARGSLPLPLPADVHSTLVPFTGYLQQLTLQRLANLQVPVGQHQQLDPQAANTLYQKGLTQAQTVIEQSVQDSTLLRRQTAVILTLVTPEEW